MSPNGGLAGFESVASRQHAAVDDAAQSGNVRELFRLRPDGDVAGAGADDFDEGAGGDPAANRTQMSIERANGDGNSSRQAGFLSPAFRQTTGGSINRPGIRAKAGA